MRYGNHDIKKTIGFGAVVVWWRTCEATARLADPHDVPQDGVVAQLSFVIGSHLVSSPEFLEVP